VQKRLGIKGILRNETYCYNTYLTNYLHKIIQINKNAIAVLQVRRMWRDRIY